jgi:hypothetical protein
VCDIDRPIHPSTTLEDEMAQFGMTNRAKHHFYQPEFDAVANEFLNILADKSAQEEFHARRRQIVRDTIQVGLVYLEFRESFMCRSSGRLLSANGKPNSSHKQREKLGKVSTTRSSQEGENVTVRRLVLLTCDNFLIVFQYNRQVACARLHHRA